MQDMKLYAEFLGRTMQGRRKRRSGPKPEMATTGSVRGAMRRFCNAWEWKSHLKMPKDIKYSMAPVSSAHPSPGPRPSDLWITAADKQKFIDGELAVKIGLVKSKRRGHKKEQKSYLTHENYVHMHERLWYNDFHDYIHEGYRVDNGNLLNVHSFTSARLAEICQAIYRVSVNSI